jgi:hypothetical protein
MATKIYTKSAQYSYPYPSLGGFQYIDAIYVDSVFFYDDIPITGAILTVVSTRSGNLMQAGSNIFIATFDGSAAGWRSVGGYALWNLNDAGPHTTITNLGNLGLFFGMGLNMLDVRLTSELGSNMVFNVDYSLEVHY